MKHCGEASSMWRISSSAAGNIYQVQTIMVIRYNSDMASIQDLQNSIGWKAALEEAKKGAAEGGV